MEAARSNRVTVGIYGEQAPTFLPRTLAEGEAAVAALLGPVIAYDEETDSELMHSLEVYFDANRSWQEGASRLGIHKQTLVYRIRRIEELTGRKLGDIQDQTELYLALKTWQMLHPGTSLALSYDGGPPTGESTPGRPELGFGGRHSRDHERRE